MRRFYLRIRNSLAFLATYLIFLSLVFVQKTSSGSKKVLLVRSDAIGDLILLSSTFSAYRALFPNHEITLLVAGFNSVLAKKLSTFDALMEFDYEKWRRNLFYKRRFLKKIKQAGFDIVINTKCSRDSLSDFIVGASGARERVGDRGNFENIAHWQKPITDRFYTRLLVTNDLSEIERNKQFVELLGGAPDSSLPKIILTPEENQRARHILKANSFSSGPYIVINPVSRVYFKRWPLDRYIKVMEHLVETTPYTLVVTGSKDEMDTSTYLHQNTQTPFIDLIGKTDLVELAAIIAKAKMYIGNDTAAVHIAAAVGTPTLCIMGGGHFGRFFPYGDLQKNRIVYDQAMTCKNDNWRCGLTVPFGKPAPCVAGISVQQVIEEIEKFELDTYSSKRSS